MKRKKAQKRGAKRAVKDLAAKKAKAVKGGAEFVITRKIDKASPVF